MCQASSQIGLFEDRGETTLTDVLLQYNAALPSHQVHEYQKNTNTKTQIHKYKYTNANTQIHSLVVPGVKSVVPVVLSTHSQM